MRVSIAHQAEYWGLRSIVAVLGVASLSRATKIGARLAALGYRPFGVRRNVVESQIRLCFPEYGDEEVARIASESYRNLGITTIESFMLPALGRDGVLSLFDGADGWHNVEDAMRLGRGLILVGGHFGNWEAGGAYIAARGVPVDAVVRRMTNPLIDRYFTETRQRLGVTVIHDRDAVRRTARSVQEGRAIGFLADQGVKHLASTYVPFFGRPAKTPRGPAVFALRWDIPIIFATALRQPGGKYHMILEAIEVERTGDRDADIDRVVARFTAILEKYVRKAPEQYFWHHRRWRRQQKRKRSESRAEA